MIAKISLAFVVVSGLFIVWLYGKIKHFEGWKEGFTDVVEALEDYEIKPKDNDEGGSSE